MAAHAILSASGAHRWMNCPPSAQLEQQFSQEISAYAKEGTFAHLLAELMLRFDLGYITKKTFTRRWKVLTRSELFSVGLEDYIRSYVSQVLEQAAEAWTRCADSIVLLEQQLNYSTWVPEGFGTGDVVIIADDLLEVIDLKYGKGVPVSAKNNPQIRLYGLGAINHFGCLYDIRRVRMTIIQPRLDSISTDELSVDELLAWACNEVQPKAALAMAGEGKFCSGEHCRFCRARFTCRARAEANLELAKMEFRDAKLLRDDEIAEVLAKAADLVSWAGDISGYALDQAENHGKKWPGWKLVEGRSNRKYSDEEAVATELTTAGYAEETIYEKKLYGITALEKLLGKKRFNELLNELIIKPAGKPVLVPESDKRPEINSTQAAAADFATEKQN